MSTTDREELMRLLSHAVGYCSTGDVIYDNVKVVHEKILAWHEQKVAEAVSKDKILNNPDEFVDYIKTNGGEFIEKAPPTEEEV